MVTHAKGIFFASKSEAMVYGELFCVLMNGSIACFYKKELHFAQNIAMLFT
jgi:hypothetical protein